MRELNSMLLALKMGKGNYKSKHVVVSRNCEQLLATANKKNGISVLQPQGTELYQQLDEQGILTSGREQSFANTLILTQ